MANNNFHQSFQLRGGRDAWLAKGLKAIADNPLAFKDDDAINNLGIGSKKVESLEKWMQYSGLAASKGRGAGLALTTFGELVRKYDAQFTVPGSLWLVQYGLCQEEDQATSFFWFWNFFGEARFTREELTTAMLNHDWGLKANGEPKTRLKPTDEVGPLLSSYVAPRKSDFAPALGELGLMRLQGAKEDMYERVSGKEIPPLLAAAFVYAQRDKHFPDSPTISLKELLEAPGSVGKVANLEANALIDILNDLRDVYDGQILSLSQTAGLNSVTLRLPNGSAPTLIEAYFRQEMDDETPRDTLILLAELGVAT